MQKASGYSTTPNVAGTISYKAWNSPADMDLFEQIYLLNNKGTLMMKGIIFKHI